MSIQYKKCPKCGSLRSVRIVYGMPSYELFQDSEAGKVRLGGCIVGINQPDYFCKDCEHEWNRQDAIEAAYARITIVRASVGGFGGPNYEVEVNLDDRTVTWVGGEELEEERIKKRIRAATATWFRETMLMIGLLDWKAQYTEPRVVDGTHWAVEVMTGRRKVVKQGSNAYPAEWDMFCKAISQVTGRRFT